MAIVVVWRAVQKSWRAIQRWLVVAYRRPTYQRIVVVADLSEVPDDLDSRTLYVVGKVRPKWVLFLCPCLLGHRVQLSLQASHRRRWRLLWHLGLPTLVPSVAYHDPPYCHYHVRVGQVLWVAD